MSAFEEPGLLLEKLHFFLTVNECFPWRAELTDRLIKAVFEYSGLLLIVD